MRVCIVIDDLGDIPRRKTALLDEVRLFSGGERVTNVCFVGLRQSRRLDAGTPAYQPHVMKHYTLTRVANMALRLVGARLLPKAAARGALRVCAPALVEAILACDPDLVFLDVGWGGRLASVLEPDFPRAVVRRGCISADQFRPVTPSETSATTVSIVLPTYDGSTFIRQSIRSCLDQSHRNLELLVVDDGSRQNIAAIVEEFGDPRLRYIRHATNRGLPAALNTGFSSASGTLLTWTSDDNYYAPDAIERMAGFLHRHPDVGFVYASMHIIDETGSGAFRRIRLPLPPADLPRQNGVGACFLYRREVYREVGDYCESAALVEDYDYWVRVSKRFRMQRLLQPLYLYRHHAGSLTSQHGVDGIAARFDTVRQQHGVA